MTIALPGIPEPQATVRSAGHGLAQPVFFDGLAGMYHAASGDTAVLFVSPWGFEELCARTTHRRLAERLAALGYPCLRFDLPGTCHSARASSEIAAEDAWRTAALAAFDHLHALSGAQEIIVIAQGAGALLAGFLAQEKPVDGLVLLGPAAQGRMYLREVAAWTAMTRPEFRVGSTDGPEGGLMSGGFVLSAATANEIKRLKLMDAPPLRTRRILLTMRPDHPGDAKLAAELSATATATDTVPFGDYADYVSSAILSAFPEKTAEAVVSWLVQHFPPRPLPDAAARPVPQFAVLDGDGYREKFFRFGPSDCFFGALTTPADRVATTAMLILNTGADHSIGWGRSAVDLAREMARAGFAVMRMDLAGVGETPPLPDQSGPVMYTAGASDDVTQALDWLVSQPGIEKVILVGRCSGAYSAFISAASDARVAGAFLINVRTLHWDPDLDVFQVIREPTEPLDTYKKNLADPRQLRRIFSGELKISTIVRKLSKTLGAIAERKLAPVLRNRSKHFRFMTIVRHRLKALKARNAAVAFVYSRGDPGLFDLYTWLGPNARNLPAYPNLRLVVIEDADHNLTPLPVRAEATRALLAFARSI